MIHYNKIQSNIIFNSFEKGGPGSGRHKDTGHELAERIENHNNEIKRIEKRNEFLNSSIKTKTEDDKYLKQMKKELVDNDKKIASIKDKIRTIQANYKPDMEFA